MLRVITLLASFTFAANVFAADWEAALNGAHRSDANKARDEFRHPRQTLEFFGLTDSSSVIELSPGGGWYTEVLAPVLAKNGKLYAAHFGPNEGDYARRSLGGFLRKLGSDGDVYGNVTVIELSSLAEADLEPVDLVLAFRNVHSWMRGGTLADVFSAAYARLKPGGIFGVVQHRANDGISVEVMKDTGYITEDHVIAAARSVGFQLDEKSEINANPKDTADYEGGVWTLPPSLNVDDAEKDRYRAIGESDRMTLRFIKPVM
jgi:predicted methyltransferase